MADLTVAGWLQKGEAQLTAKKVPEARANAELIMAHVLKTSRPELALQAGRVLVRKQENSYWHLLELRARRQPLAYVLGSQPFCGLDIEVSDQVLVPRPETEELVVECERLLKAAGRAAPQLLEIGTGTGCIAIALARAFPEAVVYATELSAPALRLAEKNAVAHHVIRRIRFIQEDLFKPDAAPKGWADLVVSNPPYIPTAEIPRLEPEVLREPRMALDGGKDGLDAVRAIVASAPRFLRPGGFLALEIGHDQGPAAGRLLAAAGFKDVSVRKDLQGQDRIATGKW